MRQFTTTLFLLAFSICYAQKPQSFTSATKPEQAGMSSARLSRIDKLIEDNIRREAIPGGVGLIIRDGKVVYYKAFGHSDGDKKIPLKKDDIFRIASQSKAITSLAIMILFEEGKFLLDDPISRHIPEFKNQTVLKTFNTSDSLFTTEPAVGEITIRHLLTHTSGIDYAAIGSDKFKAIYAKAGIPSGIGTHQGVLADKIKTLARLPLKHHPGKEWTYGLNNDVLGYLVEVVSGMSFNDFLQQRIFKPLGMKDTYFFVPAEKHNRVVSLYQGKDGKTVKMETTAFDNVNPDYPKLQGTYYSGGAGLCSTIEDYAKFLQMFLNGGEFNNTRILSRKTIELMMTNQLHHTIDRQFGLGFGLETTANDHSSISSIGTFEWGGAFNTDFWADPKEKMIGLFYTNIYQSPAWDVTEKFKVLSYQAVID